VERRQIFSSLEGALRGSLWPWRHDSAGSHLPLHYEIRDTAPNPEENYCLLERKEILGAAIGELRPRVRQVVEFHPLQEHSITETARILGISKAAPKTRMFHAKATLRRMPALKSVERPNWVSAG
jgi:DNA-directed RNA polymerase specialized sigma24 family protein